MSVEIPSFNGCCLPDCRDPVTVQIPGPQGEPGEPCTPCINGINAYTQTTVDFTQPAVGDSVIVNVQESSWIAVGQVIYVQQGGYYEANAVPDSVSVQLKNLGYTGNAAPAANVPSAAYVSPGGLIGPTGAVDTMGALLAANNLNDVISTVASRNNLGLTSTAVTALNTIMLKADNLAGLASAATSRTNLGVAIGSNVQAFNALLLAIAGLSPIAANQLIYGTGANTVALATLTSFARTLLDDTTATAARSTMGNLLPRYGILGSLNAVNCNSAGSDNAFTIENSRYRIDKVMIENASISLTTSTCGLFTAAGGAGTTLVADQAMSALTASAKFKDLTLDAVLGTDVQTATTLYFRIGTAQGSAATVNVWLLGWALA